MFTAVTVIPLVFLIKGFESGELVTFLIGVMLILTEVLLRIPKEGYKNLEKLKLKDMIMLVILTTFVVGYATMDLLLR